MACTFSQDKKYFLPQKHDWNKKNSSSICSFCYFRTFPTYLILIAVFYLFSFPTLSNTVNLPSARILENFFTIALPIIFYFLTILSVFSPLTWATKEEPQKKPIMLFSRNIITPPLIVLFIPISIYCWHLKPLGMKNSKNGKRNKNRRTAFKAIYLSRS